nr:hypothetical protein [Paenibacillus sp. 1_12]
MTLRDYIWTRRISRAAFELCDTDQRVLDVAVKYGFSSHKRRLHEHSTRLFSSPLQPTKKLPDLFRWLFVRRYSRLIII